MFAHSADSFDGYLAFNEGWYASIARNFSHHSWLEPTVWPGRTDLNVPPFYSLVLFVAAKIFGAREMVFRSVSILFSLSILLLVFLIGRKMSGPLAGLIASALLAFCPLFILPGRNVQTDSAFIAFMLAATLVWLYLRETKSLALAIACGLLFGLALFTKQFAILTFPAIVLFESFSRQSRSNLNRYFAVLVLIAVAVPLAFYQYYLRHDPGVLFHSQRYGALTTAAIPGRNVTLTTLGELFYGISPPLFPLFLVSLLLAVVSFDEKRRLPLFGALAFIAFFFFVPKHTYYIMGALPFLALLSGAALDGMKSRAIAIAIVGLCVLGSLLFSLFSLGNLKYGYHRFSDICATVDSAPGNDKMLIVDNGIITNYEPAIRYYCPDVNIVGKSVALRSLASGKKLSANDETIFLLDYSGPEAATVRNPYVITFYKSTFGPSIFGFAAGFIPADGRSFVPGRMLLSKISGGALPRMAEIAREPSLALTQVPPGYTLSILRGALAITPKQSRE